MATDPDDLVMWPVTEPIETEDEFFEAQASREQAQVGQLLAAHIAQESQRQVERSASRAPTATLGTGGFG